MIPKWLLIQLPACRTESTIWSPVSMRALTTMYPAPPTTATRATHVRAAASDRLTLLRDQPAVQRPEQRRAEQGEQDGA